MNQLTGYLIGSFWKLLSVVSKFGFLLLIVPELPEGIFSQYLSSFTICLLCARLLSFGTEDQLPVIISGSIDKSRRFMPVYWWLVVTGFLMFAANFCSGNIIFIYCAVVVFQLTNFLLCGIIRSFSPGGYEKLINLPSFFYFILLLFFPANSSELLLHNWILATAIGQMVVLIGLKFRFTLLFSKNIRNDLIVIFRLGFDKMISSFLALAAFRGLVVLPKYISTVLAGDSLAFAISIGEGCWQLAMVVVNRNYSYYCRRGSVIEKSLTSAVCVMVGMGGVGFVILKYIHLSIIDKISWPLVGWSLIFFGAMSAFMEIRYYCWAHKIMNKIVLLYQLFFILIQVFVILFFSENHWLQYTSLLSCSTVSILLFYLYRSRKAINATI